MNKNTYIYILNTREFLEILIKYIYIYIYIYICIYTYLTLHGSNRLNISNFRLLSPTSVVVGNTRKYITHRM